MTTTKKLNPIFVVALEGVPGVGKSTRLMPLFDTLQKTFKDYVVHLVPEPVDEFKRLYALSWVPDSPQSSVLNEFYGNMSRWGFTFQIFCAATRATMMRRAIEDCMKLVQSDQQPIVLVSERTNRTDKVFLNNLGPTSKIITPLEHSIYHAFCDEWEHMQYMKGATLFHIFANAPLQKSMERIRLRDRPEEKDYKPEYQVPLIEEHNKLREKLIDEPSCWGIFDLDCSLDAASSQGIAMLSVQLRQITKDIRRIIQFKLDLASSAVDRSAELVLRQTMVASILERQPIVVAHDGAPAMSPSPPPIESHGEQKIAADEVWGLFTGVVASDNL